MPEARSFIWLHTPSPDCDGPMAPIQVALEAWRLSVGAVLQGINRTAKSGQSDPKAMATLLAAVEVARQQCEKADFDP